jgi:N-acetyl-1-D-myo-inositol-2-amino-2-deoxy-alpha-D-glucopyranoside deacetylase
MQRTLLALFAHPDDESFAAGGTLARYASQGVRVVLVTATRGEAGIVHDEGAANPEDMGQVRERELRCACGVLGIQELRFLGYRDSGMAGTPENQHPQAFCRAAPAAVVGQILELFRQFRPQVVLTFGPDGGYGHPDHVAIHRHATAAWEQAGDVSSFDPPRKLYYTAISAQTFRRIREAMWRHGLIPERPSEEEIARRGAPEDSITTSIDIRDFLEPKIEALRCHRTQLAPDHPWLNLPLEFRQEYMGCEYFSLAQTRGVAMAAGEEDLFAGLGETGVRTRTS